MFYPKLGAFLLETTQGEERLFTGFLTDFTILVVPNLIIMQQSSTYYLHCYIAGLQYYEVLEVWKKLEIGQSLQLIPEPDNRYDENAVIVAFQALLTSIIFSFHIG